MSKVKSKDANNKTEKKRRPPKKISESYLHNAGLYYLERFAASSAHFKSVMMRKIDRSCNHHKDQNKEDCVALLDKTIEKFQSVGLLDDVLYTRGMVHSMRRRGLSSRMVQAKLRAKGVPFDLIKKTLDAHTEETDGNPEITAAVKMARRKKIGPYLRAGKEDDEKIFEKSLGALARAGFSYDIAKQVLEMSLEEAEEISVSGGY